MLNLPKLKNKLKNKFQEKPRFWLGLGISLTIGTGAIAFSAIQWHKLESSLPDNLDNVLTYARPETLTIKASDNTVLAQFGDVSHETLTLSEISPSVKQAFIAIEDNRYEKHKGVDYQGILRAAIVNLKSGELVEGGSTITQQLARIVYLDQQRNWTRKIKEFILAQKIEEKFTKDQILEKYLNLVYLGSGAYGIADASWVYFSKPVNQLTLPEIATLAGITPGPSLYSPLENPSGAKTRRNLVLKRMQEEGFITPQQAEMAIATPLETKPSKPKRLEKKAPYFVEYIQKELPKYVSDEQLKKGGIIVETTLNLEWQEKAENIIKEQVTRYGKWQRFKQGALVAINPNNGQIQVMVGGTDFENNQYNRVTQAKRQPGSTFKTFVYATAIASGFTPYKTYLDAPYIVDGYQPKNYGDKYKGNVPIYQALTYSLNVVAVKTLINIGSKPIIEVAQKMGIESELKPTYSLALGASEVNLLELTSAYGTLATQGIHIQSHGINRILDAQGKVIYQANFASQKALNQDAANITTWMLEKVVEDGTGIPAQIGRPAAGKTGTSDKARDLWFIGYIPQLVTGVWLGNDDNTPTYGTSGTSAAIWRGFMLEAVKEMPIKQFTKPPGNLLVKKVTVKAQPLKPVKTYQPEIIQASLIRENDNNNSERQNYQSSRRYRLNYSRRYSENDDRNSSRNYTRKSSKTYSRRSTSSYNSYRQTTRKRSTASTKSNSTVQQTPLPIKTVPQAAPAPVLNKPTKNKE